MKFTLQLYSSLFCLCVLGTAAHAASITLLPDTYQEIKAWGCFPSYCRTDWDATNHAYDIYDKPSVQTALYKDLGINFIRVDIQPRFYNCATHTIDTTQLRDMVQHLQIARNNGITNWIVSVWSPPCCMKLPGHIDGSITEWTGNKTDCRTGAQIPVGTDTKLDPLMVTDFCDYVTAALSYLKQQGVGIPDNLSIQNEPLHSPGYDGCVYNDYSEAVADRQLYQTVIKTMRTRLDAAGLGAVRLLAMEGNNYGHHGYLMGWGYTDFGTDAALNAAVGIIGTHSYDQWGGSIGDAEPLKTAAQSFGKELWMSEWGAEGGEGTSMVDTTPLGLAIGSARHFAREMVIAPFTAWFWWMGYNESSTLSNGGVLITGKPPALSISKTYHVLKAIWTRARPGCRVKHLSSSDPDLIAENTRLDQLDDAEILFNMVAFETNTTTVVLLINHTTTNKNLTLAGLDITSFETFETTASADMVSRGHTVVAQNGSAAISLPARSIQVLSGAKRATRISPPVNHAGEAQNSILSGTFKPEVSLYGIDGRKIPSRFITSTRGQGMTTGIVIVRTQTKNGDKLTPKLLLK